MNVEDNDRRIREVVMDWLENSDDKVSGPMRHYALQYLKVAELQNDDLKRRLLSVCDYVDEAVTSLGVAQLGAERIATWEASKAKMMADFGIQRKEETPR